MFSALRKPCCSPAKRDVGHRQAFLPDRFRHHLRLVRRHDLVFETLKQDERAGEAIGEVNRRALHVEVFRRRIRSDQRVEIARFELVRVARQHFDVADSVVAGACLEGVVKGERGERRVAAGAAAPDDQASRRRLCRR